MNKVISPGELSKGQFITLLEWEPIVHEADGFFRTTTYTVRDNSYKGDVLQVVAICLPFIVVNNLNGCFGDNNIDLDTRRVKLMELTEEYVKAATTVKQREKILPC